MSKWYNLSGKQTVSTPSIGFRFHAGDEELEELVTETDEDKNHDLSTDSLEQNVVVEQPQQQQRDVSPMKEYFNKLGKRTNTDNNTMMESLSNTSDTWRKINEIKGKLTKTFEGKILEIKTDRKLDKKLNSKENSISDSEDNSESSKLSNEETPKKKKKKTEITVMKLSDIKISQAATVDDEINNKDEVEAGVEISEEFNEQADTATSDRPPQPPPNNDINYTTMYINMLKTLYSNTNLFYTVIGVVILFVTPLSLFCQGVVVGIIAVMSVGVLSQLLEQWLKTDPNVLMKGEFKVPDYKLLPALKIPVHVSTGVWFNEYNCEYDPETYSVTRTVPVYLQLDSNILKLSYPQFKVSKRATYNEAEYRLEFVEEKTFNISNCCVLLLPDGLTKRRLWSKKYPIVIKLNQESHLSDRHIKETKEETIEVAGSGGVEDETTEQDVEELSQLTDHDDPPSDGDDTFCDVTETAHSPGHGQACLNLFARCDREKEHWYRKLLTASKTLSSPTCDTDSSSVPLQPPPSPGRVPAEDVADADKSSETDTRSTTPLEHVDGEMLELADYLRHMAQFVDATSQQTADSADLDRDMLNIQWFNAFVNRVLFDILRSKYWIDKIHEKIQRKLSSLRLPYYVEEIIVSELNLGTTGPCFRRVSQPVLDERGVWIDMDLTYDGFTTMTIVTKLNLVKLQRGFTQDDQDDQPVKSPMYDSDVEDSAESSDDDESPSQEQPAPYTPSTSAPAGRKSSKRIFRIVENVAQSKYFHKVAQTKYIQKAIEGVSKTELKLRVELRGLIGTLVVNIPPPPSDRLWYGFRGMPKLWLTAQPIFGKRTVNFQHVTNWIEKKLIQEFQKLLVLPNMDDLIIPMTPASSTAQTSNINNNITLECSF